MKQNRSTFYLAAMLATVLACLSSGCRVLRDRPDDTANALRVVPVAACPVGTLRYEGRESRPVDTLVSLIVYNCPGQEVDGVPCTNTFDIIGGRNHVGFEHYPVRLGSDEMLVLLDDDYFGPVGRMFYRGQLRQDSTYTRLAATLAQSSILLGKPTPRERVRSDKRVSAFVRKVEALYDVYSVRADEINGCSYGFNALDGPQGRVRLGLLVPLKDATGG